MAAGLSVWKTKSFLSVCFLTMISFVVASRPPTRRNPSELMHHRNFSYHARARSAFSCFCAALVWASLTCSSRISIFVHGLLDLLRRPKEFLFGLLGLFKVDRGVLLKDLRMSKSMSMGFWSGRVVYICYVSGMFSDTFMCKIWVIVVYWLSNQHI